MDWLVTRTLALSGALACLAVVRSAAAEEVPSAWLDAQVNEHGQRCQRRAEHKLPQGVLVACGGAGVWELAQTEAGPRFVRSFDAGGEAVGFFTEADGRLWVKLLVLQAKPLSSATPVSPGAARFPDAAPLEPPPSDARSAPPAPSVPAPSAAKPIIKIAPRTRGEVLRSAPGEAVISLGSDDGIARGDKIELALELEDGIVSGDAILSREALAVGVVTSVSDQIAKVKLGLNESVPVGAVATRSRASVTASLAAPPRVADLWHLEGTLRPFVALGELGGGVLLSGVFGRRFASGLHLWGIVDPAAVGDVENFDAITAINAAVFATYDSQYFEMGLGIGAQSVNDTIDDDTGFGIDLAPGSGLMVAQYIRLGAVDGLNLTARTSVALFHSEFLFGGLVGTAQIPVTRGYWLQFGGGGGSVGYGYGEIGLRVLLRGNGGVGSTFLTVSAGGAGVFRSATCPPFEPCSVPSSYAGAMGGFGLERRF